MSALSPTVAVLCVGLLGLAVSIAAIVVWRFERFVGLRYLLRSRRSKVAPIGLAISGALVLLGLAALFGGRGVSRGLETAGVSVTLLGGLGLLLFALLRVFSVFTTVSTMGVVLGVASLVVVLAVTSGFEREYENKVLAVNAHLLLLAHTPPSTAEREAAVDGYLTKLADLPGVRRLSKFSISAGDVMIGKVGATLKGVDFQDARSELRPALIAGSLAERKDAARCATGPAWAAEDAGAGVVGNDEIGHIVLGAELAHRVGAKVGDCLSVVVPFGGRELEAQPIAFSFAVVGIFRLGFNEYDTRLAYIRLEDARRMGKDRPVLFGVEMRFDSPQRAQAAEEGVLARVGYEPRLVDWQSLNRSMFTALEMQKVVIALFLMIIIVVAAFNILASLTMIVLGKVREMAILSAMGARRRTIMRLFLLSGTVVGFVGVGLGLVYGLAICALAVFYGYPLDPKVYAIASLPVQITLPELLFVAGSTQLICMLATLYPSIRAGRTKVVDGLRYG